MGVAMGVLLLAGALCCVILKGINILNIIFIALSVFMLLFGIFAGRSGKSDKNNAGKLFINIAVYTLVLVFIIALPAIFKTDNRFSDSRQINRSVAAIRNGDFKGARISLEKMYGKDPSNPLVNQNLSAVYLKERNTELARKHLDAAYPMLYFDENVWFNYGMMFFQTGDYRNALVHFEKAIQINPNMIQAHIYAGTSSYRLRDLRRALYHLENARFLKPDMPDILYEIGKANLELMQYETAEESFSEALKLKPQQKLEELIKMELSAIEAFRGRVEK